jgi:SAM-dependent methyltransferase
MASVHDQLRSVDADAVHADEVRTVTIVCFLADGRLIMVDTGDRYVVPAGAVRPGEDVLLDTILRIPLEVAGFRRQGTHLVAAAGSHLVYWVDGARYYGNRRHAADTTWWTGEADEATELLRSQGDRDVAEAVLAADRHRRTITDDQLREDSRRLLDRAYLTADTAEGGSGFGGTPAEWRAAREHLCDAITADITFLDVGCANGLLMESVTAWSAERGHRVEPYGVDHSPGLIDLARRRLPQWRDRLFVGDALTWRHPDGLLFDLVAVITDVVPAHRCREMISHLLERTVAPGGRLLVSSYGGDPDQTGAAVLRRNGFPVDGETRRPARGRPDDQPSAWVVKPGA